MTAFKKEGIYFLALGGADEIGMNLYVYGVDGKLIIVDAGYGFLNDDYPGMDMALADASILENFKDDILGMFISHAHEDHFGAVAHILPKLNCPVYGTDFALGLIAERLKEYKIFDANLISVKDNPIVKVANFEVEFINVVHSVPETSALMIRTKYANVFHATDWRFDDSQLDLQQTDFGALKRAQEDGVTLFVCDSTNVLHSEKQPSEFDIRQSLISLVPTFKNGLLATCFASNLMRLESLVIAADKAGRTPVLVGRSLVQNMRIAKECGYFTNLPTCLDSREAQDISADKALYICTGSQGNYRSALTRIVAGESKDIKLCPGDSIIFSSKIIPGNEARIEAMQEKLITQGIEVITEETALVHTTGHAGKDEIKKMYELLKPQIVLPVHGDKKFIREHKRFAESCGIKQVLMAKNGDVLLIKNNDAHLEAQIPTDVLGVDRRVLTALSSQLVKNRRQIAYNGSVFISAIFDAKWHCLGLKISSKDILEDKAFAELRDKIEIDVMELLKDETKLLKYNESRILDFIRIQVRRRIEKATDIKPVTFLHFYHLKEAL